LRRGLPYGASGDPMSRADTGEHGIIFMALCASLFRQFEFVQQQWMNYGLDFNAGNDTCPVIGYHREDAKFVIPADPKGDTPPFICAAIPQFVTTRGGEYFFLPSLSALRQLAMGTVDPT
jgi:deferrochelatase/peroxidase EfeB